MSRTLSRSQVLLIGNAFLLNASIISMPSLVIRDLSGDFWQGFLLALLYGMVSIVLFGALASRFPRKDLFEGIICSYPVLGRIVVLVCVLFFMGVLLRDIRATADFVKVSLLITTPLVVIAACMGFSIFAIVRHGRISVARMIQLLQPLLIVLIILIPFMSGGSFHAANLLPMFRHDAAEVFRGGSHFFSYVGEAIGITMIATHRSWSFRYSIYSVLLGWTILTLLVTFIVLALGTEIPPRAMYPTYEMVRKLRITDFLDRIDLPMVGIWLPAMIVKTSFSLYIVSNGISQILPKFNLPQVSAVVGIGATAGALLLFQNTMQMIFWNPYWTVVAFGVQIVLPLLLLALTFLVRRQRSAKRVSPSP